MKTPDEIKLGMEIAKTNCLYVECCEDMCPYNKNCDVSDPDAMTEIPREMVSDALAYIQQLEEDNAQKDERIQRLEMEREKLLADKRGLCGHCRYSDTPIMCEPCLFCLSPERDRWEWRGVEEDEACTNR